MKRHHDETVRDLRLNELDDEARERTAGRYRFTVTHHGGPHTAFCRRTGLETWAESRGLQLPEGDQTAIGGEYVRRTWGDPAGFWDCMTDRVAPPIPVLSNGEHTLGIITEEDGRRVINTLNVNAPRPILDRDTARAVLGEADPRPLGGASCRPWLELTQPEPEPEGEQRADYSGPYPVPVESIHVEQAEGRADSLVSRTVDTFSRAQDALFDVARNAPIGGGYHKTDIVITWADGTKLQLRADVKGIGEPRNELDLRSLVRRWAKVTLYGPAHLHQADRERYLAEMSEMPWYAAQQAKARRVLDELSLRDKVAR